MEDKFKELLSKEKDKEGLLTLDPSTDLGKELKNVGKIRHDKFMDDLIKSDDVNTLFNAEEVEKRTLAIIPCFNEEATIGSVVLKTRQYVDEVIVVDDGSVDNTAKVAEYAGATVLRHGGNKGKSTGVKTGFNYALKNNFDYVVTLDGDGQHEADEIPNLLEKLQENKGVDLSIGERFGKDTEMPRWRRVGKRVLDYATSFGSGGVLTDSQCGFRAFSRKAVDGITPRLKGNAFSVESEQLILANQLGLRAAKSHVSCKYGSLGDSDATSTKTPASHGFGVLGYILWLVAEKRPLLFIGTPGIIFTSIGIFLAINTLQQYNISGIFSIPFALLTSFFLMVGALAMFIGILLNTLPHIITRTIQEEREN